jgi:hypothetical protein
VNRDRRRRSGQEEENITAASTAGGVPTTPNPIPMSALIPILPVAAAGWSLLYLLFGGGLFGAVVIFVVAKFLGK